MFLIAGDFLAGATGGASAFPAFGFAAALLVLGGVELDLVGHVRRSRFLLLLGDASYSIYLSHLVTLGVLRMAWGRLGLPSDGAWSAHAFATIGLLLGTAAGCAVYLRSSGRCFGPVIDSRTAGAAPFPALAKTGTGLTDADASPYLAIGAFECCSLPPTIKAAAGGRAVKVSL